jgi:dipeptidyl aminopeptidase/acylaminoacyl peptidase
MPVWAPDGKHFAFTNTTANTTELWIGDAESGSVHRIPGIKVNATYGQPVQWMSGSRTLLVQLVPAGRGAPPSQSPTPVGPNVQESSGKATPVPTFEDLLQTPHDAELFDYYVTSQLASVDALSGKVTQIGTPAVFDDVQASPDAQHILIARLVPPYSYLVPAEGFAKEVEVWSASGDLEKKIASLPTSEHVPIEGVLTGPRDYEWVATKPATLVWAEALDEGNPKSKVPYRDHLFTLAAPFSSEPVELVKLQQRYSS